jgi:NitT/TauT family transport system substrate-binding protein
VGVVALGSASHRVARLALTRARLDSRDVEFVALPSPRGAVSAVRSGRVDAICYTDPVITELEQGGDLRVLVDTRTVRGNAELFGGPLPTACLSAPVTWVAQNPRAAQAMASAVVRGLKWLQTAGPSDIIKAVPEHHFKGDRARYLAAFSRAREAWTPVGLMPAQGPANVVRMLSEFMDTPSLQGLDLSRTFTNEFALVAKARFRA